MNAPTFDMRSLLEAAGFCLRGATRQALERFARRDHKT
jgi:hypothetical protein